MSLTAIIAGTGALPGHLAAALPEARRLVAAPEGLAVAVSGPVTRFRIERLVPFLDHLADAGVTRVAFAGAMRRPRLEAELFDARTAQLVPRLLAALGQGDDAGLRAVAGLFEDFGFEVVAAAALAPDLVPAAGVICGAPSAADRDDAARAAALVADLGRHDIGQGAVVAQGLCLALETLPGTDAMLDFVAGHAAGLRPDPAGGKGVLFKGPKPGQDRRIDLPAIGPETVRRAAAAGLAGIAWEAGGTMLVTPDAVRQAAEAAGLFLWAREP